ncbi:hypothetical protein C8R43DRAFT_1006138 [Mycena crocata]|nr:hypothetical protein C8R43DRAFT_1006138 [Mycena crocata]
MKTNGHAFIDILKIDIEGNEFEALEAYMDYFESSGVLPFGQLQLEIHTSGETEYKNLRCIPQVVGAAREHGADTILL